VARIRITRLNIKLKIIANTNAYHTIFEGVGIIAVHLKNKPKTDKDLNPEL
jgi:hypothetical protein